MMPQKCLALSTAKMVDTLSPTIQEFLNRNGIFTKQIVPIKKNNVWKINDQYIIKLICGKQCAEKCVCISEALEYLHIRTIQCIDYAPVGDNLSSEDMFYLLMYKIPGEHIKVRQVIKEPYRIGTTIGIALAELHVAMSFTKVNCVIPKGNLLKDLLCAKEILGESGYFIPTKAIEFLFAFAQIYPFMSRQLIHRDIKLQNLLFSDGELISFLDLDSCEENTRLYDLAFFGLTMLHEIPTEDEKSRNLWKQFYHTFIHGYHQTSKLTEQEIKAFYPLLLSLQTIFSAFYIEKGEESSCVSAHLFLLSWILENNSFFSFIQNLSV